MTEENKQLLLKDLCARLPYGVKCRENRNDSQICTLYPEYLANGKFERLEPYLRKMPSLDSEEYLDFDCNEGNDFDWLNSHHIDYRGLIEKGLALEAPSDMYNN